MLVYDLIPERLGLDMSDPVWDEKRLAIEHASAYACISENTRRDLLDLKPAARSKRAEVVPLGVDEHFTVPTDSDVAVFRQKHDVRHPYFVVVGERQGVSGYKNVRLVFEALRDWPEAAAHELICVGGLPDMEANLTAVAPRLRVRRLELSDEDLRLCYSGAVALLHPSRYEGFGLPVAEAMACGCPVIATRTSSLPEVAGEAAIYVDPDSPESLRDALANVYEPTRRAGMIAAGLERAAALRWAQAASAFASVLSAAAAVDTTDQRSEREAVWKARRKNQNRLQLSLAAERSALHRQPELAHGPSDVRGLKGFALRHLPPSSVRLLRALHASTRYRVDRVRRAFATK
jgi:glycosyltransferase involved in cell wall biosynthesis